jgi:hypothetical protein
MGGGRRPTARLPSPPRVPWTPQWCGRHEASRLGGLGQPDRRGVVVHDRRDTLDRGVGQSWTFQGHAGEGGAPAPGPRRRRRPPASGARPSDGVQRWSWVNRCGQRLSGLGARAA